MPGAEGRSPAEDEPGGAVFTNTLAPASIEQGAGPAGPFEAWQVYVPVVTTALDELHAGPWVMSKHGPEGEGDGVVSGAAVEEAMVVGAGNESRYGVVFVWHALG